MGKDSAIEWTDHTFNSWWGCQKVSEACRNCYAEAWAKRTGHGDTWGPAGRRRFFGEKHWNEPRRWDAQAEAEGVRRRVFCSSMADVFEELPEGHPDEARMRAERGRLWRLILETKNLDWLLLTKRPESRLTRSAFTRWPDNVWIGTTVEDQATADVRIPALLKIPARLRFLSCEPMLGPIDLEAFICEYDKHGEPSGPRCNPDGSSMLSWVIGGGESGAGARPAHPDWARSLRDQCAEAGVPFLWKQWGAWGPLPEGDTSHRTIQNGLVRLGKKNTGRLLDGVLHNEMPT